MDLALDTVRGRLAAVICQPSDIQRELGSITLHPHQVEAATALLDRCRRLGGALLADPVGAGKTYTALACARCYPAVTVVAPAVLRETWQGALRRTHLTATIHSVESLGRSSPPPVPPRSLVIVDEAHHARNPATRRYRSLARLTWGADVLLLTATPIHNSARDLQALVGLFAPAMHALDAWAVTLRREQTDLPSVPSVAGVEWLENPSAPPLLDAILGLPAPMPARDAGAAHALGTLSLVRQWLSSHAALARAIQRRRLAAQAMLALVERGEPPTLAAIKRSVVDDSTLQLTLGIDAAGEAPPDQWHRALRAWIEALDGVRRILDGTSDADRQRAARLHTVLCQHPGTTAVAFTHSATTARAIYAQLAPTHRSAGLWGPSALVASGRVTRAEVLGRLANSHGSAATPDPMRIDLLVTTDVLSEGVDLQTAGLLVHLDLPWTPARIEQRVGRLRRPGSRHATVQHFAFGLPPAAHRHLRLLRRLCDKARTSREVVGIGLATAALPHRPRPTTRSGTERLLELARRWGSREHGPQEIAVAGVRAGGPVGRLVAALRQGDHAFLLCDDGVGLTMDPGRIAVVLDRASGADAHLAAPAIHRALRRVRRWCRDQEVLAGASPGCSPVQRAVLRRLNDLSARVPRVDRDLVLRQVDLASSLVRDAGGAGADQALASWLSSAPRGTGALESLIELLAPRSRPVRSRGPIVPWALLVLVRD